jgi:hypothetical protein
VTDTLAYDGKGTFMAVKSFIIPSPGFCFNCQISYQQLYMISFHGRYQFREVKVFVIVCHFHNSLIHVSMLDMGLHSKVRLQVLFFNIRLKWKQLIMTHTLTTLTQCGNIYSCKKFIVLSPSFVFNC